MSDQLSADLEALRIDRDPPPRGRGASVLVQVVGWVLLLGLAGGAAAYAWPRAQARIFKTSVHTAAITSVSPSQANTSVSATGYVVALVTSRVQPQLPGRVARVLVREGDRVRAGQVLMELDAAQQRSAIAAAQSRALSAQARVAVARANLAEAQVQLERQQRLLTTGSTARATVEDLEARMVPLRAAVEASLAETRAAQAEVTSVRVGLSQLTLAAPFDSVVLNRPPQVGEVVGAGAITGSVANATAAVIELMDPASLVVEVDVPEGRFGLVRVGGPCEIALDAFPDRRFRGTVSELGRRVDRSKATVPVRVRFGEAFAGALPEMSARVKLLSTEEVSQEALQARPRTILPAAALTARSGAQAVFTLEDGVARLHRVRVGERSGDGVELLEGPTAGARVIVSPPAVLQDGNPVQEASP